MALKVDIDLRINATEYSSVDLGRATGTNLFRFNPAQWATGTGSNQSDRVWSDQRSVSSAEDLDLAGGFTSSIGTAFSPVEVTIMAFSMVTTTSGVTLNIGGKASNTFINWVADASDELILQAGGAFVLVAPVDGYGVTASTGDILEVTPSAALTYNVLIAGRSA